MIYPILSVIFMPLFAGLMILASRARSESRTSSIALIAGVTHIISTASIGYLWASNGQHNFTYEFGKLFQTNEYSFPVSVYVDSMSVLWLTMSTLLSNVVIRFSSIYLHKDPGFQRFFGCLMFLLFGLTILALAGSLDTFMAGWEFVGICSFFLISFYRERDMPVRNAFKVFSVYRFCDAGLLLSAWLTHVLWHDTQSFAVLRSTEVQQHIASVSQLGLLAMTCLILLAAAGKSAQFPFTFWLSRAMEGPTPSSAIFYGALSVHAGLFLLFRTSPIWTACNVGPILVGVLGLITMITANGIARVQSNIKGQIAFSSAAHVGIMFIELAFGFKSLAMLHMFGNASFRCYQLLISPSSIAYLLRLQGSKSYQAGRTIKGIESFLPERVSSSLYVFAINDGFLENLVRKTLWAPMTALGKAIHKTEAAYLFGLCPVVFLFLGLYGLEFISYGHVNAILLGGICSIGFTFLALAERNCSLRAWNAVALSNLFAAITVWSHESHILKDLLVFSSGVVFFWIVGVQALLSLRDKSRITDLNNYHGLIAKHPGTSFMLFIGVLGMSGFPISPAFIGQDMLLHHAVDDYVWLAVILALTFSVNGLALMRIYAKVCLGSGKLYRQKI